MSVARSIVGTVGAALLSILATWIALPDWLLRNLSESPVQTVIGFLVSAVFGGAVVFAAHSIYVIRRLGERPVEAFDDLKRVRGLASCRSLAEMVEPVRNLAAESRAATAEAEGKPLDGRTGEVAKPDGPIPVTMEALGGQPWQVQRAVLDSAQGDWRDLPIKEAPNAVLRSMLSGDGILKRRVTYFDGMPSERDTYFVAKEWKLLLMEDGNLDRLRVMVNG